MTLSGNTYNKLCQLKLNDIYYHVNSLAKFSVNFDT